MGSGGREVRRRTGNRLMDPEAHELPPAPIYIEEEGTKIPPQPPE